MQQHNYTYVHISFQQFTCIRLLFYAYHLQISKTPITCEGLAIAIHSYNTSSIASQLSICKYSVPENSCKYLESMQLTTVAMWACTILRSTASYIQQVSQQLWRTAAFIKYAERITFNQLAIPPYIKETNHSVYLNDQLQLLYSYFAGLAIAIELFLQLASQLAIVIHITTEE